MNTKKLTILTVLGIIVIAFFFGMNKYQRGVQESQEQKATQQDSALVRMHSPVFGPQNARVTIVEFFDPACEACRAFYPFTGTSKLVKRGSWFFRIRLSSLISGISAWP